MMQRLTMATIQNKKDNNKALYFLPHRVKQYYMY